MHKCKCHPNCEADVKSKSRHYARGHAPASHIFNSKRCKRISKAMQKHYAKYCKENGYMWEVIFEKPVDALTKYIQ